MSSSNSTNNNNNKILYQLWTDGKGSFAVRKEKEYNFLNILILNKNHIQKL